MGTWRYINPQVDEAHQWVFACYTAEAHDGKWVDIFLFRDAKMTTYGGYGFRGEKPRPDEDFQAMARRVIADSDYRESMLQPNDGLKTWWNNRNIDPFEYSRPDE